jgi:DNA-binding CsgD family transcriptional regulator
MQNRERLIIIFALCLIVAFLSFDLVEDFTHGASYWHVGFEAFMALIAASGAIYLLHKSQNLSAKLSFAQNEIVNQKAKTEIWQQRAQSHIEGLSIAIKAQFNDWGLTNSEREIALLLLKGLSIREIGKIRGTNEKTVRGQATLIYQKSGLNGRADLSAFFLEDLLG